MAGCHLHLFGTLEENLAGKEKERGEAQIKCKIVKDNHVKTSSIFIKSKSRLLCVIKFNTGYSCMFSHLYSVVYIN